MPNTHKPVTYAGWKLVIKSTGAEAYEGETYTTFRGEAVVLTGGKPPHKPNSTGRVYVGGFEYFPSVLGMEWVQTYNEGEK